MPAVMYKFVLIKSCMKAWGKKFNCINQLYITLNDNKVIYAIKNLNSKCQYYHLSDLAHLG